MRIIQFNTQETLKKLMHEIKVDPYGINIMLPKAIEYVVRLDNLPCIQANILKQEMLSIGADAAVARGALTGTIKHTGCLLIGNLSQFTRLCEKLKIQSFGLKNLAFQLADSISNYQKEEFIINAGKFSLPIKTRRPYVMGIVNLTPDSFSGDGLYNNPSSKSYLLNVLSYIQNLIKDGADIIDIGGESTRPGAKPVCLKEELQRIIPVIKFIRNKIKIPISVDTYKPEIAERALDCGADLINDISTLKDPKMIRVVSKSKCGVIIMHSKGTPLTMQKKTNYVCLIADIMESLRACVKKAEHAGISKNRIILDPGIGFGKTLQHNLEIIKNLREFKVLGFPLLIGPSRKSFIGNILRAKPSERTAGTISASIIALKNGANIVRVHDVLQVKQAVKIFEEVERN